MRIRLMRDGRVVDPDCKAGPAQYILVPVREKPRSINARELFVTPPVEVLLDKYNPAYEHYWADKVVRCDVYKLSFRETASYYDGVTEPEVLVYQYERTDERTVKDYDRINPKYLPHAK